jgi:CRISPR-associated endonuclease Csn1
MKTTGQAHEQTMRSPKGEPQGMVKLNQGRAVADNGGMVRVDVFKKDKKYYYVPIYVHDMARRQLPNRATTGQDVSKWIEMTPEYQFLFSLYPNDYVRIVDGEQIVEGYYVKFYRNNGNICLTPHDKRLVDEKGKQIFINKTAKNVDYIKKYSVDLFGNLHEVKEEKRRGIS